MVPEFRTFMPGSTACINRIGARTKTSKSSVSALISLTVNALFIPNPALFISTEIGLVSERSRASTISQSAKLVKSARNTSALIPYFAVNEAARSSNLDSSRATKIKS